MPQERRAYVRVTCNLLPSDFKIPKEQSLSSSFCAQAKDISPLGVRLVVPQHIPLGHRISLSLSLPTNSDPKYKNVNVNVSVTWVSEVQKSGKFEIGCRFLDASEEAQNAIHGYYSMQNAGPKDK